LGTFSSFLLSKSVEAKKNKRRKDMKKTLLLATMLLVLATQAWGKHTVGNAVELQIRADSGKLLPFHPASSKHGNKRVYAEAVKGDNYSIVVRNLLNRRVGIVVAVDGRNIISGEKSWLKNDERMYILEPYEQGEYKGWRTAKDTINRFYFADVADSYAGAFNDTSAMGVISVAVYPEVIKYKYEHPAGTSKMAPQAAMPRMESKGASPLADKAMESAGTGYGHQEYSPSYTIEFDTEAAPAEKIFVKYEWRATLCAKGIIACNKKITPKNRLWDEYGYAPAPPNKN
jgi:hypothetical protein